MLSFRLKYRTWQDTRMWNQIMISGWGKIQGWMAVVANLIYCHFHLPGLLNCSGIRTHTHTRTHRSLLTILLTRIPHASLSKWKGSGAQGESRVRERVSMLTLYWKLLLYGVPCIMTCHSHWEEALTTFSVISLQELHYSCCHIYITLDPDSDCNHNSYTHPLIQA